MNGNQVDLNQVRNNSLASTIISSRTIANYRLVEMRGSGGMANVFKAIQLSLDRPVAIKIMHPHLNNNETFISRFEKEAKRAANLQHENIVAIIDYGCDAGEYYIAMEYIDGTNLGEILKTQKKLPLEVCLFLCYQVAEGLKYAHGLGIIHRDIKPANIMLSYDGRVLITDFGIAKATSDHTVTAVGQVVGSPAYMSPEQAAGKATDHRSDLFNLGIILFEIILGEKPFRGDTYQSLVTSIMSDDAASLRENRLDVTPEIDQIVQKALAKAPDSRYQTAEELSDDIYAQLAKFKISSTRKMMSEYLKNPIRVTQKLRAEKISDHMESALYFLTVGEGKLAEAKREFLDVLRFDKHNRDARKYLAKLESFSSFHKPPQGFWKKHLGAGITSLLIVSTLIVLFLAVPALIPTVDNPTKPNPETLPKILISKPLKELESGLAPFEKKDGSKQIPPISAKQNPGSSLAMLSTLPSADKKAMENASGSLYNYPRQNLNRFGALVVLTPVPARLIIDDEHFGWTNGPPIKLQPGRHLIDIKAEGYQRDSRKVFLKRDVVDTLLINLSPK